MKTYVPFPFLTYPNFPVDNPAGKWYNISRCTEKCNSASRERGDKRKMAEVKVREGESLDSALRRFKRSCARSAVLAELRKREHYEKPSVKRKKKSEAARKRKYK